MADIFYEVGHMEDNPGQRFYYEQKGPNTFNIVDTTIDFNAKKGGWYGILAVTHRRDIARLLLEALRRTNDVSPYPIPFVPLRSEIPIVITTTERVGHADLEALAASIR